MVPVSGSEFNSITVAPIRGYPVTASTTVPLIVCVMFSFAKIPVRAVAKRITEIITFFMIKEFKNFETKLCTTHHHIKNNMPDEEDRILNENFEGRMVLGSRLGLG